MEEFRGRTPQEWAEIEAESHDPIYADAFPFGLNTLEFSVERALWFEDYAFKKGRRIDRGDRTKKFLQLLDLDDIAGKHVLDIGCGFGQYSVLCAKKGAVVTGVELSPVGIQRARLIAAANGVEDSCTFVAGEFTQLDFPDEQFDVTFMHEVFHHAVKYRGLKEKVDRVTKPGGRILIVDGVRGDSVIELGRRFVKYLRYRGRPEVRKEEEDWGDVPLVLEDIERFAQGFPRHEIHFMNYLYMIKESGLKHRRHRAAVRFLLWAAKRMDDVFLAVFPFLRKRCSEVILIIDK